MLVELDKRDLMLLLSKQKPNIETFKENNLLHLIDIESSTWNNLNLYPIEDLKKAFELCKSHHELNRIKELIQRSYHNRIVKEIRDMRSYNDFTNN